MAETMTKIGVNTTYFSVLMGLFAEAARHISHASPPLATGMCFGSAMRRFA